MTDEVDSASSLEFGEIGLSKGQIAPDIELKSLEGKTIRLSDYWGKRVIFNFWATCSSPCRVEIPEF